MVNLGDSDMLSEFFNTQWQYEVKNDWTTDVKKNLDEFGITKDFDYFREKSKESFLSLVRKKAREFEFNRLLNLKLTRAKSKMKNVTYSEFKM